MVTWNTLLFTYIVGSLEVPGFLTEKAKDVGEMLISDLTEHLKDTNKFSEALNPISGAQLSRTRRLYLVLRVQHDFHTFVRWGNIRSKLHTSCGTRGWDETMHQHTSISATRKRGRIQLEKSNLSPGCCSQDAPLLHYPRIQKTPWKWSVPAPIKSLTHPTCPSCSSWVQTQISTLTTVNCVKSWVGVTPTTFDSKYVIHESFIDDLRAQRGHIVHICKRESHTVRGKMHPITADESFAFSTDWGAVTVLRWKTLILIRSRQ